MKYSAVLLDFDDTLIDTVYNTTETLNEVYDLYKLAKHYSSFDYFYKYVFKPANLELWRRYELGDIDKEELLHKRFHYVFNELDEVNDDEAAKINIDYLARVVQKTSVLPGAIEILEYLKGKYKLVLLSNGFTELQYTKIENSGMTKYFDKIVLSDQVGVNKPHPDIFRFALSEVDVAPNEAIMIGDNYHTDITGAYDTDISQIWYNPSKNKAESFIPTYTIKSLLEIKDIL